MMNNNKILTVSYGTFSCTLEGFDDSFGTMKAIAEYFRDLASDDRYFGAEPPQPDADMLARIAQKEVSRRVEAREQDGKIVLSAVVKEEADTAPAAAAIAQPLVAAATGADVPTADISLEAVDAVVEDAVEAVEIEEVVEAETAADVRTTPVEIDDAVAADEAEVVVEEVAEIEETAEATAELEIEEAPANDDVVAADQAVETDMTEDENDIVPGQSDAEVGAFFEDEDESADDADLSGEEASAVAPVAEVAPEADAPAPDSIAAKLQRIRAVVAQQEEAPAAGDYSEDEHAEASQKVETVEAVETQEVETKADAETLVAEAAAEIEDALDVDTAVQVETAEESEDDDLDAILSRIEAKTTETTPEPVAETLTGEAVETAETSVEDSVSNLFEAPDETPAPAPAVAEVPKAPRVSLRKRPRAAPAEDAPKPNRRSRVIKVKRADLQAAIEKGDLEEYTDAPTAEAPEAAPAPEAEVAETSPKLDDLAPARRKETVLSAEDEADLARELAELESDISTPDAEAEPAPEPQVAEDAPLRRKTTSRNALPDISKEDATAVNRLLAETDQQMDEPESATRRDAFAHLRAAVAAKKADVSMGSDGNADAEEDAFRNDLADVVRPRRPESPAVRTERPSDAEPAPLKLVAEQRIDVEADGPSAPVQPRRVAATEELGAEGDSFSEFAAEMGAATLPQLLEAAAAYMSFIEGRAQFSRPQLMTKVRQAGGDEGFSREEGLRSFGQLLRAGKIEKIKGGRFTVSDDIGYRPDERAAG